MTERKIEIIKTILYSTSPVPIENLIEEFSVSERTVKYDISEIRKELEPFKIELLNKKGLGYYFSPDKKPQLIEHFAFSNPEDTGSRNQTNLLVYTLFHENPAPLQDIADQLFFDVSTIKRFIEDITVPNQQITLKVEHEHFEVVGDEYDLRKFYTDLMIKQIRQTAGSDIEVQLVEAFPNYEAEINITWFNHVKNMTQAHLKENHIWISKNSIEYLIIYLFVLHYRNINKIATEQEQEQAIVSSAEEYKFAEDLLKNIFWNDFSKQEIPYLIKIMFENDIFSNAQLQGPLETKLTEVIASMIAEVNQIEPALIIDQEQLAIDLRPHLKHTIRKTAQAAQIAKNPLFHQIKQKYKKHYKIAQKIYQLFCNAFNIPYSDEEASLVAIYLYKNTINEEYKTFKAYLICGTGRGFSKLLEQRLANIFPNIVVLETLSSFYLLKKQHLNEADIIISTIDLPDLSVPVVKVTSFLGRRDIQLINQILEYGTSIDSVSFATDVFETDYTIGRDSEKRFPLSQEHATIFTSIFLELYNVLVNLPEEYEVNQDKLLGITIHVIIALPRYFEAEGLEQDEALIKEVMTIEAEHKRLAREINVFLNKLETELNVGIPYTERYALYQYILN